MATDSDTQRRSLRLLYECAVGTDVAWVRNLVVCSDMKDRVRNEEVALAYAAVLWRSAPLAAGGAPPDDGVCDYTRQSSLTAEQQLTVAGLIVHYPKHRDVLCRVLMHSVCSHAAKAIRWTLLPYTVDAGRQRR